jgi:hypothetical protein
MNVLTVPPAAVRDAESVEVIRAWVAEGGLHCSLKVGMWGSGDREEAGWGILIADVIRHVSNALREQRGGNAEYIQRVIVESLMRELGHPTSGAEGAFIGKH